MSDVVLSGMGLATGSSAGAERFWQELLAPGDALAVPAQPVVLDRPSLAARRASLMAGVAREAMDQAGLAPGEGRWIVVVAAQADDRDPAAAHAALPHAALPHPAELIVLSNACASVGVALAWARTWLRSGRADRALVLGACVRTDHDVTGMAVARTLAPAHARPFDPQRDGTVVGEGAGALVLERRESAVRRGAVPLAALAGVACRVGGGSMGLDEPVAGDCIAAALADAGGPPVGYVHAHATGTWQGDDAELATLARLSPGPAGRPLPVSSHKGLIGHLLHCSMFPGVVAAVGALRDRRVPGTPGLTAPRLHEGLRVLRDAEPCVDLEGVLVNGFGFGDNNAAVVLRRGAADEREERP
jgi:acyl transferase domain-containing protein